MKLLLDTHIFIGWDSAPARLSPAALAAQAMIKTATLVSAAPVLKSYPIKVRWKEKSPPHPQERSYAVDVAYPKNSF